MIWEITQEELYKLLNTSDIKEHGREEPVVITYCPEYTDIVTCPTCEMPFNIFENYTNKRCPRCGQRFDVDLWIS